MPIRGNCKSSCFLFVSFSFREEKKETSLLVERNTKRHSFSLSLSLSLSHIRCDLRLMPKKGEIIYKARRGGMIDRPRIYRGANERKNSTKKGGERETREVKYTSALLILRVG